MKNENLLNTQIKNYISDLSKEGAFEIWSSPALPEKIYIPYMMNDAMECYIILHNATVIGSFKRDLMENTFASIEETDVNDQRALLIIKQFLPSASDDFVDPANVCTVWFDYAEIKKDLYRFDEICHFWKEGFEQWSQLTYIIGTMYDKYLWGGDKVLNETELSIMKLIEFAPFRAYAPAPELFEELYDNSKEAAYLMKDLAVHVHDYSYAFLCHMYIFHPSLNLARLLCHKLNSQKRFPLYNYIYKLAVKGASAYPSRKYINEQDNIKIHKLRTHAHLMMKEKHFTGNYPEYHKDNIYVRITEEHPFTIMDWDEISFSQKWMISICEGNEKHINLGFFDGKKISSQVLSKEEFEKKY